MTWAPPTPASIGPPLTPTPIPIDELKRWVLAVGNLDERVSDRVLYDILIQAGRLVDLYIPRDKETDKPKGYAFAQYESQDIAHYAVKLFSGLVTLYRRTLKFAISGQDKSSLRPDKSSSLSLPIPSTPTGSSSLKSRPYNAPYNSTEFSSPSPRFSEHKLNYAQVTSDKSMQQPNGYRSYHDNTDYNYSRRVFGAALDSVSRGRSARYELVQKMAEDGCFVEKVALLP
ncbi:UNVERIFIED_CONTAM: Splicing factor 3B subunit [Sesamum angustifolium]|uniref:Splicing factor 3B subunit n=1 Tax=Sesamum angustifolium TaxID=2727405 RepID=A0AAW2L424_9LAMI